jgi:hypothetical protein
MKNSFHLLSSTAEKKKKRNYSTISKKVKVSALLGWHGQHDTMTSYVI